MSFQPVSFRVQANDTSPVEVIWKFDNSAAVTCENCVPFRGTQKNPVDVDFERLPDSGSGDSWTRTNGLTALRLFGQVRNTHHASASLHPALRALRLRAPIDVNVVLSLCSMAIATETQYLVVFRGFARFLICS